MAKKSEKKKSAKKRGRGSKYNEFGISQKLKSIEGWARHGSTLAEIAQMLGVSEATLYRWKGSYPEFCEALRVGAREADGEILNSAFRQAVGYREPVTEIQKLKKIAYRPSENEDGTEGPPEIVRDAKGNPVLEDYAEAVTYEKYFEPDPKMTIFMLSNRLKEHYQIKVESDGTDKEIRIRFEEMPPKPENQENGEGAGETLTAEELMG